jgi:signal transduction histidine kinase
MKPGLLNRLRIDRLVAMTSALGRATERAVALLVIPTPEDQQLLRRITLMELDIILPLKLAAIGMLVYSFYFRPWMGKVLGALEIAVDVTQYFLWFCLAATLVSAGLLFMRRRLPLGLVQWIVFATCLLDGLFLAALTLVTGGYSSFLYWLFLGLIVRSAVSVPRPTSQLMLNLTLSACYVLAGILDIRVAEYLDEDSRENSGLSSPVDNPAEPLLPRLMLLLLMTLCSYGVQVLLEKQRRAEEEAREFAVREGQLRSAGRMAAEFVHQIKNPLAIINNAAFSLQRALKDGRAGAGEQIRIIQEEVERSDRIITQIMGYAQLSEGRVEKLNVVEELNDAIDRVFPPGTDFPIRIHRDFAAYFPPLLMQRRHVNETFINILQNAREALDGRGGNIHITARCRPDLAIEVTIRDDGPGILPERHERVFEAYYTTKEKGTGLGLATVKHNVELYGGSIQLESELGKGTAFVLLFPARSLINIKVSAR